MRNSTPQAINLLIDETKAFNSIQSRSLALVKLNQAVYKLLPMQLQSVCRVANYRHSVLIIEVSSASWLTRVRYEQEKLLSTLRAEILPGLASIQFSINPALHAKRYIAQNPVETFERTISQESGNLLEGLAQQCPDSLKAKLIKLASHAKKPRN